MAPWTLGQGPCRD